MKRTWLIVGGLLRVLALAVLPGCYAGNGGFEGFPSEVRFSLNSQQEGIWVTGSGEVTVTPDIASLRMGVDAQAPTVAEAQSQAAEAMDRMRSALTDNGVAEKDVQTQYFSIQQVTRWDREKEQEVVIGYRVTNTVTAKIREIDKTGSIIDAVAEAGGDLTRIDSISFSVDDPSAYHEQVRQKAMADAKAKAEQLAKLAGITLGKPTYISESTYQPPTPRVVQYAEAKVEAAPETPISPGEMEISLTVQVVYSIRN